jgi:hypothetical protein
MNSLQRPEHELLLLCTRARLDETTAQHARTLLQGQLDWEYLLQEAGRHRIVALLQALLNATAPDLVPAVAREQLRRYTQFSAQRGLRLTMELLRVVKLFADHSITAVPYKGPLLAATVYGNLALRECGDLDILIDRRDMAQARKLLLEIQYAPYDHPEYACEFVHPDSGIIVELHWQAVGFASSWQKTRSYCAFPLALDYVRPRLGSASLSGMTIPDLAPEDLLLILCVHGSKHLWKRLIWICDIARLLEQQRQLDWPRLLQRADSLGSRRMLLLGLHLAHTLSGAPVPPAIQSRIQRDPTVITLAARTYRILFTPDADLPLLTEPIFSISMRERRQDKGRMLRHYCGIYLRSVVTPTDKDRNIVPLPRYIAWLVYLIHPIRLVYEYGLRPIITRRQAQNIRSDPLS